MHQEKNSINFSKAKKKYCWSLHYNSDSNCLFINGKEIYKSKGSNKNLNFSSQFCLVSISNKFGYVDAEEISFKVPVTDMRYFTRSKYSGSLVYKKNFSVI